MIVLSLEPGKDFPKLKCGFAALNVANASEFFHCNMLPLRPFLSSRMSGAPSTVNSTAFASILKFTSYFEEKFIAVLDEQGQRFMRQPKLCVLPGWEYTTKGISSESHDARMRRKRFSHFPFFIRQKGLHVLKPIDRKVLNSEAQRLMAGSCRSLRQKLQHRAFLTGMDDVSSKQRLSD